MTRTSDGPLLSARIIDVLADAMADLDNLANDGELGARFAGTVAIPSLNDGVIVVPVSYDPVDGRHYADVGAADKVG